jgi:hypothetical protein
MTARDISYTNIQRNAIMRWLENQKNPNRVLIIIETDNDYKVARNIYNNPEARMALGIYKFLIITELTKDLDEFKKFSHAFPDAIGALWLDKGVLNENG